MGRFSNKGSGGSSSVGGSSIPAITSTVTAGEVVSQGRLAVLGADNLAYMGDDPSVALNAVRPILNKAIVTNTFLSTLPTKPAGALAVNASNASNTLGRSLYGGAALSNGNYVVAWQLNATPYTVQFAIFNNAGVQQGSVISVDALTATDNSGFNISIAALTGGGFALAFSRNLTPWAHYAVYDNAGSVVKALTTLKTGLSGVTTVKTLALSNGGFAVVYMSLADSLQNFVTFDASGTIVTTHTAIGGGYTSGFVEAAAFTAAQGGGFVVAYSTSTTTRAIKYSNAGAVVVATQPTGGAASGYSNVCVLAGGGYAVATLTGTDVDVSVFNSAGVQLGSTTSTGTSVAGTPAPVLAPLSNGDVAVAAGGAAGNTTLSYWSGTTGLKYVSVLYATLPLAVNTPVSILPIKAGGVSVISGSAQAVFDASGALVNDVGTVNSSYGTSGTYAVPALLFTLTSSIKAAADVAAYGSVLSGVLTVGQLNMYMQKLTPIGVFAGSAAAGVPVPIQYTGNATLTTAFAQPINIDAQALKPPGQRMSIIGNSVIMQGLQPANASKRNIN